MRKPPNSRRRAFALLFLALSLGFSATGCSDNSGVGVTYPVSGKVTIDDAPLTVKSTVVLFKPDASKGNTSTFEPSGTVDSDGVYVLRTASKTGAPPGWYKVVVTARDESVTEHPSDPKHRPVAKSLTPPKYGHESTSPFSIEVVEKAPPGAYDLKLSR